MSVQAAKALNRVDADPEEDWISAARAGDRRAFKRIVERHHHRVMGLALGLTGDYDLAEDVAQETFIRAWRHLPGFEPRRSGSFRAWLCRIAHNYSMDLLRRHGAAPLSESQPDRGPSPFESASRCETDRLVREAVLRLPDHCRAALVMREFEGLTYAEIAHALDIPQGTVMSRLHTARRRLADDLAPLLGIGDQR